jgi:hypothetical protein
MTPPEVPVFQIVVSNHSDSWRSSFLHRLRLIYPAVATLSQKSWAMHERRDVNTAP